MRNIVLIICTLSLVMTAQLSANPGQTAQQTVAQAQQAIATPAQQTVQPAVQSQTSYEPVITTTAQPAVYESDMTTTYQAYQPQYTPQYTQQYYYRAPVRNFRPVRQANYNSVPIVNRPNRPGHVYGNTVRFLYRLGR